MTKRYGSVAAAEKVWGVPAPRDGDATRLRSACRPWTQLTRDGEWRKLVADYRLFLDDLLREKYSAARQLVKSIDPHHAVSFRMSNAGDPLYNWDAALPYDFYGLAEAVDVWEPEAYGRIGDWERVRAGDFTAAYARLCDAAQAAGVGRNGLHGLGHEPHGAGPGEARVRGRVTTRTSTA